MKGNEIKFWEIVTEAVTAVLALLFLGLQVYYAYVYETSAVTMLYHLLPPLLLYAGMTALQIFPELLNGAGSEPLKGNVRVYAVRMVQNSKLLVILGIWIPSAADAFGIQLNAAYSLVLFCGILANIGYYIYRIYKHNRKS